VQARGDVHETALSRFQLAALTVCVTCQNEPFQRSANVLSLPLLPGMAPTP
jgi:hypothetical protein